MSTPICHWSHRGHELARTWATHTPCCSTHGKDLCCSCYRATHFVEVGNCCDVWADTHPQTDDGAGSSPANPPAADVPPPAPSSLPRLFVLDRHTDVTGQSGTGVVVEGVRWSDGTVSVRWLTEHRSFANWQSITHLLAVHGHGGATELRWLDADCEA